MAHKGNPVEPCEIIYSARAKGWKWRVASCGKTKDADSRETFQLFYECVAAARANGLQPNVRCP
jgi:hypothetical protein